MNWKKLRNPARATFKNPNFQSICKLEKFLKYSLGLKFKSRNSKSMDELGKAMS